MTPLTTPLTGVPAPERWRPVVGFEGWYAVSSLGNVRRVAPAPGSQSRPGRMLRPGRDRSGRPMVHLHRAGQHSPRAVAHLVAAAFLGPRPAGWVVTFRNGDPADVRAVNLIYRTRHQLQAQVAASLRKLTASQAAEIRAAADQTPRVPVRALAARYGITYQTVSLIQRGEAYHDLDEGASAACSNSQDGSAVLLAGAPTRPSRPGITHIAAHIAASANGDASHPVPVAACTRALLDPATLTPAGTVATHNRCGRHGCHQRWPAASDTVSSDAVRGDAA